MVSSLDVTTLFYSVCIAFDDKLLTGSYLYIYSLNGGYALFYWFVIERIIYEVGLAISNWKNHPIMYGLFCSLGRLDLLITTPFSNGMLLFCH